MKLRNILEKLYWIAHTLLASQVRYTDDGEKIQITFKTVDEQSSKDLVESFFEQPLLKDTI